MPLYDCGERECRECQIAFGPDREKAIRNFEAREAGYATLSNAPLAELGATTADSAAGPEKSPSNSSEILEPSREKIKYWWSEDRQFFCILINDGVGEATVSLSVDEAEDLMTEVQQTPSFLKLQEEAYARALHLMDHARSRSPLSHVGQPND
jgi:hypothetical protein